MFEGQIHSINFKVNGLDVAFIDGGITKQHYISIIKDADDTTYRTIMYIDQLIELIMAHPEMCSDYERNLNFNRYLSNKEVTPHG